MARFFQSGFELNSNTAKVEWRNITSGVIQTSTVRTGTYAAECTAANLANSTPIGWGYAFAGSVGNGPYYARAYFRVATAPNVHSAIMAMQNNGGTIALGSGTHYIQLNTDLTLTLIDNSLLSAGSSSALSLNTWYRLEMKVNNGATSVTALLNGTQFGSSSNTSNLDSLCIGGNIDNGSNTAGHWFFDDIAVNDSTGTNQTGFPGAGQIIHLKPNAAGDNNAFTVQIGGTAGAANNFTRVNEVTPDDVTTYNGDAVSGHIDDFNLDNTPSSIATGDTINVVAVGVRFRAVIAAAEAQFKVRIKKAAAGTVSSSAAIIPNSTTWETNGIALPWNYPLITYQNPDAAAWTKALLDTAQAGYTISTTNTNAADISTLWVSVDSTPAALPPTKAMFMPFFFAFRN